MQLTHVQSPALDMGTKDCMEWSLIVESPEHSPSVAQKWTKKQTDKKTRFKGGCLWNELQKRSYLWYIVLDSGLLSQQQQFSLENRIQLEPL